MADSSANWSSSLIMDKGDNILVQWGKVLSSNICANWWVAPLLVVAVIYLYWRMTQAESKLAKIEGMSASDAVPGLQYAQGRTKFQQYRGTNETLSHRDNHFGEAPAFWSGADGAKAQESYGAVTAPTRAANASGLSDLADGAESADKSEEDAVVAEAMTNGSKGEADLALALAGH